ncbi:MAG: hypothetical protein QJT81_14175 [Candidatus Thiothrix putei]|uniref:Uncharacterized protein n=1 Tax=Candidatus Thiothrix putei TaxID=3080811 RepID=A0AA95HBI6_9GAMM|nr:MAG: hypothetical protein QJT81_14175 [Candidatus Thiothrix putei]
MNSNNHDLNTLLREIYARADSLAIFAQAANETLLPSDREQQPVMLENVLYSLAVLEQLHAELKQAMEVQP